MLYFELFSYESHLFVLFFWGNIKIILACEQALVDEGVLLLGEKQYLTYFRRKTVS